MLIRGYPSIFIRRMMRARCVDAPAEPIEIELQGGIRVKLPPEQAAAYQAARTKDKTERELLAQKAGAADATAAAAEAARKKAADDLTLAESMKAGEVAKVREIASKEYKAKLDVMAKNAVADHISSALARNIPGLDSITHADMLTIATSSFRFNEDKLAVEVVDAAGQPMMADGKPVGADAFFQDFAAKRKLTPIKAPPGDGHLGAGQPPRISGKMTRAEYDQRLNTNALDAVTRQAIAQGKIILVD